MTKNDFDMAMTTVFQDNWCDVSPVDKDRVFNTVMEIWLILEVDELNDDHEETLANYHQISIMDEKTRLQYRHCLALEGLEYTPDQVEMLAFAIEYAFESYNEHME